MNFKEWLDEIIVSESGYGNFRLPAGQSGYNRANYDYSVAHGSNFSHARDPMWQRLANTAIQGFGELTRKDQHRMGVKPADAGAQHDWGALYPDKNIGSDALRFKNSGPFNQNLTEKDNAMLLKKQIEANPKIMDTLIKNKVDYTHDDAYNIQIRHDGPNMQVVVTYKINSAKAK
jgi:hypothetical protein